MGDSRVCRREYYSHPSPRGYPYSSHQTYRNSNYNNHRHQHQSHSQVEYLALSTNGEIHKTEPPFQHSSTRQQAPYLPYHRPNTRGIAHILVKVVSGTANQTIVPTQTTTTIIVTQTLSREPILTHPAAGTKILKSINTRNTEEAIPLKPDRIQSTIAIITGVSGARSVNTDGEHPERPRNWRIHRVFSGKITTDSELGSYRPQARGQFPMMGIRKSNFNKWNNPVVESGRRKKRKPSCRVTLSDSSSSASSSQSEEDKYEDWVVNLQDSKENIETIEDEEFIDDILLLDEAGDETNSECLEVTSSSICVVYEQSDNTPSDSAKKLKYKSFGL
uniref:Uncharacterized protein n=1 Tax=Ditylenchus dipsaci TaxID=166011 RepID=A0A915CKM1_9BILA